MECWEVQFTTGFARDGIGSRDEYGRAGTEYLLWSRQPRNGAWWADISFIARARARIDFPGLGWQKLYIGCPLFRAAQLAFIHAREIRLWKLRIQQRPLLGGKTFCFSR
jgi:hypothetical protein